MLLLKQFFDLNIRKVYVKIWKQAEKRIRNNKKVRFVWAKLYIKKNDVLMQEAAPAEKHTSTQCQDCTQRWAFNPRVETLFIPHLVQPSNVSVRVCVCPICWMFWMFWMFSMFSIFQIFSLPVLPKFFLLEFWAQSNPWYLTFWQKSFWIAGQRFRSANQFPAQVQPFPKWVKFRSFFPIKTLGRNVFLLIRRRCSAFSVPSSAADKLCLPLYLAYAWINVELTQIYFAV